jgi:integral membrane sensor domain MASE1
MTSLGIAFFDILYAANIVIWFFVAMYVRRDAKRSRHLVRHNFWTLFVFGPAVVAPLLAGIFGYFAPFFSIYAYIRRDPGTKSV